ncbi:MAG: hypothetical protein GVY13_07380 [Alphaproteobacteria bacterium]|jgi:20S proteasome alpha/beta subunit|nr:hypothetical protein [Alphaproteobacteria bacterium]
MTICIAATCHDGQAIVVASDKMLTAPFLTVEFDHQDAKIDVINDHCVALSAGDALCVQDVLAGGWGAASQLQNPTTELLAEQIKKQFSEVRKKRVSDLVLATRNLDFDEFYHGGMISRLPPELAMLIDSEVQRYNLNSSIIVAGVDPSGAHIFGIEDPGTIACFDRLGYHAIGSGYRHALLRLVAERQHVTTSINETVFNVFCAKKAAELAPGVGLATSMHLVTRAGNQSIEQSVLDELGPIYEKRMRPHLPELEQAIAALQLKPENLDETDD